MQAAMALAPDWPEPLLDVDELRLRIRTLALLLQYDGLMGTFCAFAISIKISNVMNKNFYNKLEKKKQTKETFDLSQPKRILYLKEHSGNLFHIHCLAWTFTACKDKG